MDNYKIRELRHYKPFVTNLEKGKRSSTCYHVNLDNFSFNLDHDYYKNKQIQLNITQIDSQTFEQVVNRSMITHPVILKYLDKYFIFDGCFCCYYTKCLKNAKEFDKLATEIYNNYNIQQYLKSSRLLSDITDANSEINSELEKEIKQKINTCITINAKIKPLIDLLNSYDGITTAYSDYGYNGCSGSFYPYLVLYKTNKSIKLINLLKKELPIKCTDALLMRRDRYPHKKIKITLINKIFDDKQCIAFWDSFLKCIKSHYFELTDRS